MAPLDDDVFRALGVARDADEATVKQAYRALALRNHPDRNPGDAGARARFDRVNRAYAEWTAARQSPGTTAAPGFENPEQIFSKFSELFGEFFGTTKPTGARRGADRTITLRITHGEARAGCVRHVAITRNTCCTRCRGSGAERGVTHACAECRGTGHQQATHGYFHVQSTCRGCNGRGRYAEVPCDSCDNGLCEISETLAVTVPPGIDTARLRCIGKGDEIQDGAPGDLYVELAIDTIGVLVQRGDDVVLETLVGTRHVMFGGTLEVATLDGPMQVTVPRGVRDGDTATLAGRGHVRTSAGGGSGDPYRELARGDQIVVFRVPAGVAHAKVKYIVGGVLAAAGVVLGIAVAL